MTGKDYYNHKVHLTFPFSACYDGSLMFFKVFEDVTNNDFTLTFYAEEAVGMGRLMHQWLHRTPLGKLWEWIDIGLSEMNVGGTVWYKKNKIAIDSVVVYTEDFDAYGEFIGRKTNYHNVMPISIDYNTMAMSFHYDYCTTDFLK